MRLSAASSRDRIDSDLNHARNQLLQRIVESYTQSKHETLKMLPP
ncbi:MAG: hypothetical protein ACUVSV_00715 [Armatimonadota bacterium]